MHGRLPDTDAIAARWDEHWALAQKQAGQLPPPDRLDRSLVVFLAQELEDDDGAHDRVAVLGATMAGITQAGTHSKAALQASFERNFKPRKPTLLARANTRTKRLALLAFPFFVVIALYRLVQDLDHYSWQPSLSFFLFAMASALCLLIAFTRLGEWLSND